MNQRERIEFLIRREYLHRKFWNDAGLQPPFPQQEAVIKAWYNGAQYILLRCGRRGAKTITVASFFPAEACFGPVGAIPKRHLLHTGPAADTTGRVGQYLWSWIHDRELIGKPSKRGCSEQKRLINMPWKAEILGKTTRSDSGRDPTHLQGEGNCGVIEDEAASDDKKVWPQYLMPTLGDTLGWAALPSTPKGRLNHFYATEKDWRERMESGDKRYYVANWTSYDNPYTNPQIIEDARLHCEKTNQMELFYQEYLAEYTSLSGAIYKGFKPTISGSPWHVNPAIDYIPGLPIKISFDWGENFRCEFAHRVDGSRIIIFDEIAQKIDDPNSQLELVVNVLRKHTGKEWQEAVREVEVAYGPPDGLTMIKLFSNAGFPMFVPNPKQKTTLNAVEPGINQVQLLMSASNLPGIEISPERCYTLIEELHGYERNPTTQKPVKVNDHSCDAIRYLAQGEFGLYTRVPILLEL